MTLQRQRRKKRKVRKFRLFMMVFLIAFLAIGSYAAYEYISASRAANADNNLSDDVVFNGSDENVDNVNVLVLGSDSRGGSSARADTIMIANYSSDTKQPKLISIMRDTYVDIPGYGFNKINAAYSIGGPELMRKTITENFGIDINYYAEIDFKGFEKLVDAVAPDGIEVTVTPEMTTDQKALGVQLTEGTQKLHGKELLAYSRFRHDANGDYGRVQRQQEVLGKLKEEVASVTTVAKLPKMIGIANGYVSTNVRNGLLLSMGTDVLRGKTEDIETMRIPMDDTYHDARYGVGAVLEFNVGGLEQNAQGAQTFLNQ
ncbi:LCP family protein [Terribacillus sp. FSL K6-0262]|uniref:LCP family protein n=1 Tax=Terribacillus TaxID=459532 RepID=UPI0030ED8783